MTAAPWITSFDDLPKRGVRRVALLGGTFDPPHVGHVEMARAALELGEEAVVWIPAWQNPLKRHHPLAGEAERLEMVRRAIAGVPRLFASEIEYELGRRAGSSFSIDTVREIERRTAGALELRFIIGADCIADLPKWREVRVLMKLAPFMIFQRGAADPSPLLQALAPALGQEAVAELTRGVVRRPITPVASNEIRAEIEAGKPATGVPEAVRKFIEERKVYARPRQG